MDFASLCDNSVSQYLNGLHDLNKTHGGHKHCTCIKSGTSEDYMATKLGNALSELLQFEAHVDGVPACYSKNTYQMEKECEELKHLVNFSTATTHRTLSRSATFPFSKTEMRDKGLHEKIEYPACPRAESLPVHLKLVSAMKGGRERQGISPKKLTVTWAHDVYDPPTTLLSHTVKGGYSHRRSSRNKKSSSSSSKHKHKGKASRSSSSDNYKKHHRKHDGNYEPRTKQLVTRDRLPLLHDLHQSTMELPDFAVVAGNDTKCGSSYLMKSLTGLHLPVAEAT